MKLFKYQGEEFTVKGSITADIAVAENDAGQQGVFDVRQRRLLFGLCDTTWSFLLHFDKVNDLLATAYKAGREPRVAVVKSVAEPI